MVGNVAAVLTDPKSGAGSLGGSDRHRRGNLHRRGLLRRALLLLPDRRLRAQESLQHHPGHLLALHGRDRSFVELLELRPFQVPGGGGHRRGVLGDLLGHRRVDSRADPGSGCACNIIGSYWGGAALGSLLSAALLSGLFVPMFYGWRLAFGIGAILGLCVLLIRRYVPESPRWLATHGRNDEAEEVVGDIEDQLRRYTGREELPPIDEDETITIEQRKSIGFGIILRAMFPMYPGRTVLGLMLVSTQAFLYNAVLFTYALVLSSFYGGIRGKRPVLPGGLRYRQPDGTAPARASLRPGGLGADDKRLLRSVRGHPGADELPVLPGFTRRRHPDGPLDGHVLLRLFCRQLGLPDGQRGLPDGDMSHGHSPPLRNSNGARGITGPIIFGQLIGTGNKSSLLIGFGIAAALMIGAAIAELILGVRAERRSLESIAAPLTAIQRETGASA
jgi:hypothetical protein